jgi:Family of unknown function (DUF5996)/Zn-finger in ubiquitin-hydrolases and other protein
MSVTCTHIGSIELTDLPEVIAGCEDCLAIGGTWVHLRMCQSCGRIGCCDSSPHRHASAHAHSSAHPIARSAEPGEDWSWCYVDNVALGGDPATTLPQLHLADWRTTKDTLHLYCQIVGKIRLATTTPRNHWWNVPLYVDVRGLTTRRLRHRRTTFEITIDLVDHALVVRTADGRTKSFGLGSGMPVADFDARIHAILGELGIDVEIREEPFGVSMTTPFAQDLAHASWDREAISRFARILDWSDSVFEEFSGWFNGKTSPVHLFWHSFDLAVTRFSGRPAPPLEADRVTREAYTHEVISFGFWPGDDNLGDAAYYCYTAPEPDGLRDQPLSAGGWVESSTGLLAILPYEAVRTARTPRTTLLAFCQSAYEAGARLAGWDTTSFESTWCPTPEQLRQLHASAAADFGRIKDGMP